MTTRSLRPLRRLAALLLLPGGLLTGCQSAKPHFAFHPAPGAVSSVAAPAAAEAALPPTVQALPAAQARPTTTAHTTASPLPARPTAARRQQPQPVLRRRMLPRPVARHQAGRRPVRPQSESGRNVFHIVLGAVLILGSVAVGLWLGGWLGLGVGAAIMLLGDYFLVLGIGGKHAWLEIFQEFFNM